MEKGHQKVAILLLALPREVTAKLFEKMDDHEIQAISKAMINVGPVKAEEIEKILMEFADSLMQGGGIIGGYESAERLLNDLLDGDKAENILSDLKGGKVYTIWERLSAIREDTLAGFLRNENPQTASLVLGRMKTEHAARVFSKLPDDLALSIMTRMLEQESVPKEIIANLEASLQAEFLGERDVSRKLSSFDVLAGIFNSFDRDTEGRLMEGLEGVAPESAEKIKSLMFTFDDMILLDSMAIQVVLRESDKTQLALALKGASQPLRNHFFNNMSERAGKLMKDSVEEMGMVRVKDVYEAQLAIVRMTKELSDMGTITLPDKTGNEETLS